MWKKTKKNLKKNKKNINLEKEKKTRKPGEPLKLGLISKSRNPLNLWPKFNKEA